ncbi:hypothetical protein RUM44_001299 [Polyplax serrata]|uniref:Uncharacterized protein n=1 Tax=Polyplax serrata TaxID=468196 RepID=A0ABR1AJN3_POLSC
MLNRQRSKNKDMERSVESGRLKPITRKENCGTEGYLYYFDDVVNQYHYVPDEQYDFFMDFYCTFGVCTCRAFYENQPPYLNLKKISRHFGLRKIRLTCSDIKITSPDHKSIRNPVLDLYVVKTLRCHPPREGSFWKKTRNDEDYRAVDLNRCQLDYKVINFNAAEIGSAGVPGWYPRRDA